MLQWADTFNRYGTGVAARALLLNGLYAFAGTSDSYAAIVADPDPTSTQKVYRFIGDNFGDGGFRYAFPGGAKATMGFAIRLWLDVLPPVSNRGSWVFRDIANVDQVQFDIETTGAINIRRGDGTILATSATPKIVANAWNHIEVKATIDNVAGAMEVRVNGAVAVSVSGVDTQNTANASTAQMACRGGLGYSTSYVKDFVVWDTTGTRNNNFMGPRQFADIDTISDTSLAWTPSTGTTGWSILDNNPPVDTTYVSAASALSNIFALGNLPADATSVSGLVLVNRSWKIDGGDGNTQMGIVSGASTGLGTDRPITTAPTYWWDVMEVDPATGVPFTPTGFNAASLKQSRTV